MAGLAFNLAFSYSTSGEYFEIAEMAPDVLDLIDKAKREADFFNTSLNPYSTLCALCGFSMGVLGNFEEGKIFIGKGYRTASEINHLGTLIFVELYYGLFFTFRGEWETAKAHFQKSINFSEEAKYGVISGLSWSYLGYVCSMLGDSKVGEAHAEKGLEMFRVSGMESILSYAYYNLGWTCHDLGDFKNAQRHTEEALQLSQKNGEKFTEGMSWILSGRILGKIEPRRIDRAEESILKGMEILQGLKIKAVYSQGYLFLGELYLNGGKLDKAKNTLKRADGLFQEMGMDYWSARAKEVMKRF